LTRLATVELQLIMQHCDVATLCTLARCNHITFQAARSNFAWPHGVAHFPRRASIVGLARRRLARASSLLRERELHIGWREDLRRDGRSLQQYSPLAHQERREQEARERAAMEKLLYSRSVIRVLDFSDQDRLAFLFGSHNVLAPILFEARALLLAQGGGGGELPLPPDSPARGLRHLTALHAGPSLCLDETLLQVLARLCPLLRTLTLDMDQFGGGSDGSGLQALAPLALMPHLTDLRLQARMTDGATHTGKLVAVSANACTHLQRLRLSGLPPHIYLRLLSSPNLRSLLHLHVGPSFVATGRFSSNCSWSRVDCVDWEVCCANLSNLRSLTLHKLYEVGAIIMPLWQRFPATTAAAAAAAAAEGAEPFTTVTPLPLYCPSLQRIVVHAGDTVSAIERLYTACLPSPDALRPLLSQRPSLHVSVCILPLRVALTVPTFGDRSLRGYKQPVGRDKKEAAWERLHTRATELVQDGPVDAQGTPRIELRVCEPIL
jgi:hypothetical protein